MDRNRYRTILEAYGADPVRWPSAERGAALRLANTDPSARRLLEEAHELDSALDRLPEFAPDALLREAVLGAAPQAARPTTVTDRVPAVAKIGLRELLWPFGPLWRPAVGFAMSAVLGVIFGAYGPAPWAGEQLGAAAEPVGYDLTELAFSAEESLLPFDIATGHMVADGSGAPETGPALETIPAIVTNAASSSNPAEESAPNILAEGVVPTPKPRQQATNVEMSDAPGDASTAALPALPDSAMPPPLRQADTPGAALANDTTRERTEEDVVVTYGPEEVELDFENGLLGQDADDRGFGFGPADMGLGFSGEFESGGWRK